MNILTYPDSRLREKAAPVEDVNKSIRALAKDMLDTMQKNDGIGLAAPQVGIPKRIIVLGISGNREVFINPIITRTQAIQSREEGCLSFPGKLLQVVRPGKIFFNYIDLNGQARKGKAKGLRAVCIQHEIDHLDGILFTDHAGKSTTPADRAA